jgi:hypothetical protein
MASPTLNGLLVNLADATRDLPTCHATKIVRDRFIDVIRQLETQHLIPQENWNLTPRSGDGGTAVRKGHDSEAAGDDSDGCGRSA